MSTGPALNRDTALLVNALGAANRLVPRIVGHLIKARVGHLAARQAQLDGAVELARQLLDELVTARTALGWDKRDGDAA
jgi:hypothetical protein